MMATTAIHKMGDISQDKGDICAVFREDEENYIGNWVTGFGFIDVKFPKVSTRDLTEEEKDKYSKMRVRINNQPAYELGIK
jgi:predicted RNA-binding protein (virulence factor B family)